MKVLGISGSLRAKSFNTATLRAAAELAPAAGVTIDIADISAIPLYNDDNRGADFPASVEDLSNRIRDADAVLIATPEYNYSIPGVLKNAIDWVSRVAPPPFADKPVAIMGASPSALGTARAQYDLRKIFVYLDARVLNKPEIFISGANSRFDEAGRLTDAGTRDLIAQQLEALRIWAERLR